MYYTICTKKGIKTFNALITQSPTKQQGDRIRSPKNRGLTYAVVNAYMVTLRSI